MIIFTQLVLVMWKIKHHNLKKNYKKKSSGIENIKQMSFQVCHFVVRKSAFILEPAVQGLLPSCLLSSHRTEQLVFSLCRLCSNLSLLYLTTVKPVRLELCKPAKGTNERTHLYNWVFTLWAPVHLPDWNFRSQRCCNLSHTLRNIQGKHTLLLCRKK